MTLIVNSIMTDPPKGGLKRPTKKPANQTPNSVYTTDTTSVEIGKKVEKPKKTENSSNKQNELIKNKTIENVGNGIYKAKSKFENGELVEQYYKLDNGLYIRVENKNGTWQEVQNEKSLSANELKDAVDCAKAAKNYTNNNYQKEVDKTGNNATALIKGLSNNKYSYVNSFISKLNSNNIVDFLDDFYNYNKKHPYSGVSKGLIELLDCKDDITMENKKNVISSLLEVAEKLKMTNTDEYKELKNIYIKYDTGICKDDINMNGESKKGSEFLVMCEYVGGGMAGGGILGLEIGTCGGPIGMGAGLVIGGIVGLATSSIMYMTNTGSFSTPSDSQKIDKLMYELHKKIKERLGQQTYVSPEYMHQNQKSDVIKESNQSKRTMGVYEA